MTGVMETNPFFAEEFPSDLQRMSETLGRAVAALVERNCVDAQNETKARLCLEEALVNAIRHGNAGDATRKVRLEMFEQVDLCVMRVYDEGSGFHPETVELPDAGHLGGRGICLIRHYADYIRFNDDAKCLEIGLRKSGDASCPRKTNA